jgi:hypothetical protein
MSGGGGGVWSMDYRVKRSRLELQRPSTATWNEYRHLGVKTPSNSDIAAVPYHSYYNDLWRVLIQLDRLITIPR